MDLVSSAISTESVADSPSVVIAGNIRIVYESCIDPLSKAYANYLYAFIQESCSELRHSWVGHLKIVTTQEDEQRRLVDTINHAGFHGGLSKQSSTPMNFCSKTYSIENGFEGAGFFHPCTKLVHANMRPGGYYLIRNGHYYHKKEKENVQGSHVVAIRHTAVTQMLVCLRRIENNISFMIANMATVGMV